MRNVILSDVDGVIVDWLAAFRHWMEKEHGQVMSEIRSFDLLVKYPQMEPQEVFDCINEFNNSNVIASLIPTNDSFEVVNDLAAKGFTFIAITSLSDKPEALANRTANLNHYFPGAFSEVICLKTGIKKDETLAKYHTALCWVEDHPKNADAGVELDIPSFLMTQEHNIGQETKAMRIDSWKDIAKWLKTF
jgi:hypothetical protein